MPIVMVSDPIIVPLPVYYGRFDTRNGRPVFPKTGLFIILEHPAPALNLTKTLALA